MVLACVLAVSNGSFIHGPTLHHGGPSTAQYETEEVHYGSNGGSNSQGGEQSSSNQGDNSIIRRPAISNGQLVQSQQKTVQISPTGSYGFTDQEKSEIRVTSPGTYASGNYHSSPSAAPAPIRQHQVIEYASTPSYNNRGYENAVSTSYQHPTSAYQTYSHNTVDVYRGQQSVRPIYHYVPSAYVLHHGVGASYTHNGNPYSAHVQPSAPTGTQGTYVAPYSSAAAVSHMSFNSPVGVSYNW